MARVFGLRLLRVDGVVLLSPAHLVEPGPDRTVAATHVPDDGATPGTGLARAFTLLQECRGASERRAG